MARLQFAINLQIGWYDSIPFPPSGALVEGSISSTPPHHPPLSDNSYRSPTTYPRHPVSAVFARLRGGTMHLARLARLIDVLPDSTF